MGAGCSPPLPPAFSTSFYILHLVTVGGSTAREAVQIKMVRSEPDSLHFERRQMDFLQFIMMKPLGTKPMFVSPQNGLKLACIRQCMGKRNCRLRWAFVSTPPTNPHIHMDCLFPNQSLVPFNFSLQSKRIEITHHISTKLHANQCQLSMLSENTILGLERKTICKRDLLCGRKSTSTRLILLLHEALLLKNNSRCRRQGGAISPWPPP